MVVVVVGSSVVGYLDGWAVWGGWLMTQPNNSSKTLSFGQTCERVGNNQLINRHLSRIIHLINLPRRIWLHFCMSWRGESIWQLNSNHLIFHYTKVLEVLGLDKEEWLLSSLAQVWLDTWVVGPFEAVDWWRNLITHQRLYHLDKPVTEKSIIN